MEFEFNEQRLNYLKTRGKLVLNACPGSGKTTVIAKKLIDLKNEYEISTGKYFGVACLSFTNTAKDEISEKYTELSGEYLKFPHKVSTIDSFINQYITLPFYYLFMKGGKRPKILDDPGFLDDAWMAKWQFKGHDNRPICFAYPPSSIRFERDGSFTSNGYRPTVNKIASTAFDNYCKSLKTWQVRSGLITTSDSAFIAYALLSQQPRIGNWLALRFPHIIVDEAQDNSAIQHAIFDKLNELGLSNLEFIGDPYQSLYEWRDANPMMFIDKYLDTENWQGLELTDDRRSPQRIIDCFSLLRKNDDPNINTACIDDRGIPIFVYQYSSTNTPKIVQHYDQLCQQYGLVDNQIVVRGNALKNKMLGKEANQKPWKSWLPYKLIEARHKYEGKEVKEAIKAIRSITVSLLGQGKEYVEIKELEQELKSDNLFNAMLIEALHDMPSFSFSISEWTVQTQTFLKDRFNLDYEANFEIKTRSYRGKFDKAILNDPIELHFKRSYSESKIPITTVHQVKGKSLDSILVFFNESKHKDNITFGDIVSSAQEFPIEKQRIIYVALSRPKHLLAMAFPDSITNFDLQLKFGNEIEIIGDHQLNG